MAKNKNAVHDLSKMEVTQTQSNATSHVSTGHVSSIWPCKNKQRNNTVNLVHYFKLFKDKVVNAVFNDT